MYTTGSAALVTVQWYLGLMDIACAQLAGPRGSSFRQQKSNVSSWDWVIIPSSPTLRFLVQVLYEVSWYLELYLIPLPSVVSSYYGAVLPAIFTYNLTFPCFSIDCYLS